jgi:site-specific recombinase XerD
MKTAATLPALIERYFCDRLIRQQQASANTIASYRDTFRLLFQFAQSHLGKAPSSLNLEDIDAGLVSAFLDNLERHRSATERTRNLRLTAIRSFFRYVSYEEPAYSAHVLRVLAIPNKRHDKRMVPFLERSEVEALLAAPDRSTWLGRRDYALLLVAVQTGLRLSELTGLERSSVVLGAGAHIHCHGKGRKERCTPITRPVSAVLRAWLAEPKRSRGSDMLFPTIYGGRMSPDAVQYAVAKYVSIACAHCSSLRHKRVTPHVLRHSAAMALLQAGVDSSVIAMWLGHESVETTQVYLEAHIALKEAALEKITPLQGRKATRYRPGDRLLQFLNAL